jgi:hypothetical protein
MEQKFTLGRVLRKESVVGQATRSALNAPPPGDGEVRRTALPDTFDGIRFEIGRMIGYVKASVNDPVIRRHTESICGAATRSAQMNGFSMGEAEERDLSLQVIDKWCREHFVYVNDPPNVEVLQTPRRMIKCAYVPSEVIRSIIDPFYEVMATVASPDLVNAYEAGGLYNSQCAVAPCTAPIRPLRFRFGGHNGTLHHVWSRVGCGDKMIDADLTEPGYGLGDFSKFEHYEEVEIPL